MVVPVGTIPFSDAMTVWVSNFVFSGVTHDCRSEDGGVKRVLEPDRHGLDK